MAFKPLTKNKSSDTLTITKTPEELEKEQNLNLRSIKDIIKTTEERIHIIFDDSGSMSSKVPGSAPAGLAKVAIPKADPADRYSYMQNYNSDDLTRLELAIEGTVDYMKNCKPHVSAVEIAPLNNEIIPLSKNLPTVAAKLKKMEDSGGTPLYEHMGQMVDFHKEKLYTRALIFTDGEASPDYRRPNLIQELKDMKIPIDFILIGNKLESNLSPDEIKLRDMAIVTGGVFMICKDGNSFRQNMKYFAPQLRWMLPSIASKNSLGEN